MKMLSGIEAENSCNDSSGVGIKRGVAERMQWESSWKEKESTQIWGPGDTRDVKLTQM